MGHHPGTQLGVGMEVGVGHHSGTQLGVGHHPGIPFLELAWQDRLGASSSGGMYREMSPPGHSQPLQGVSEVPQSTKDTKCISS